MEGFEYWILDGAKKIIANPDITVMMEWGTDVMQRAGISPVEFAKQLHEYGFTIWRIGKKGSLTKLRHEELPEIVFADLVLARNPSKFN